MPANPHPWRTMAVVFGLVLLSAFCLDKIFAPLGDHVLRAVAGSQAQPTAARLTDRAGSR